LPHRWSPPLRPRCPWRLPAARGASPSDSHYARDAQAFAYWGVDFVKIDECGGLPSGTTLSSLTTAFEQYGADLRADNPRTPMTALRFCSRHRHPPGRPDRNSHNQTRNLIP
jgi:hypothetical protein